MAQVNLGSIKFNWKGAYNAGTAYAIDDVVSYNGSSYVAKTATTGNLPTVTANWDIMSSAGTNGTNGTDLTSTLTAQGDMLYRDGSGLAKLGAGTSGQVLQTGGAGANPSWGTVSSDVVLLATATANSSSSITFDGHFSSTYTNYKIIASDISPGSNNQNLRMRVRVSNADKTDSNYYWCYEGFERNYTTGDGEIGGGGNGTNFKFHHGSGYSDAGNYNANSTIHLFNPLSTSYRLFRADTVFFEGADPNYMKVATDMFCYRGVNTALSGVSFYFGSGSIQSGIFKLYGIK